MVCLAHAGGSFSSARVFGTAELCIACQAAPAALESGLKPRPDLVPVPDFSFTSFVSGFGCKFCGWYVEAWLACRAPVQLPSFSSPPQQAWLDASAAKVSERMCRVSRLQRCHPSSPGGSSG